MNIKRHLLLLLLLLCFQIIMAQHVRVVAPRRVSVGEEFQIEYTVYTQDVRRFHLGKISSGLEKIYGPATSSQRSIRFVDGHTSSSSSISFAYVFVANKKGILTVSPARIDIGGQMLASTPVRITAVGNVNTSRASSKGSSSMSEDENTDYSSSPSSITSKDLFIKVIANKTIVHEQEPVLLTYKVYTTKNLKQLAGKMPDLVGFHVQEINLPQQKSFHKERVKNKVYNTVTWSQYVIYPQMTGILKVPSLTFKGIVQISDPDFNPFEAFGIDNSRDIQKDIIAPSLAIKVLPLPNKPANFSGGVGHFNISIQADKKEVKAGDPLSVRVVISGNGNLKLIKQPKITYPKSFEAYDVNISDKTRLTVKGTEGNMIYDQIVVPHNEGRFTINPIKFTYFDVSQQKYVTIETEKLCLKILKNKSIKKKEVDDTASLDNDIHPLKLEESSFNNFKYTFFNSFLYWFFIFILFVIIVLIIYFFRDGLKSSSADFSLKLEKNANKTATSRLDSAYAMMLKGDNIEFYEEISHALWGYVSDKLHIAVGELSRENITESLAYINIPNNVIEKFISALDECEYERYAPGDERGNMRRTYDKAITAISSIEDVSKRNKKIRKMKSLLLLFGILTIFTLSSFGINTSKNEANSLYNKGNYAAAAQAYEFLLQKNISPSLYYNLGNAYYKQDSIAKAVIAYERALRLSPDDNDIKFNLQLAQSKTIDNIPSKSEMFFITWYKSLVNLLSIDGWAWISIFSLILIICGMCAFIQIKKLSIRKTLTKIFVILIILFVLSIFFAFQQKSFICSHDFAIVISPSVVVKTTPDAAASKAFIIHEGTKLKIIDNSMDQWWEVVLDDGRKGWIEKGVAEVI